MEDRQWTVSDAVVLLVGQGRVWGSRSRAQSDCPSRMGSDTGESLPDREGSEHADGRPVPFSRSKSRAPGSFEFFVNRRRRRTTYCLCRRTSAKSDRSSGATRRVCSTSSTRRDRSTTSLLCSATTTTPPHATTTRSASSRSRRDGKRSQPSTRL